MRLHSRLSRNSAVIRIFFGESACSPEAQSRIQAAMKRGFQTRDGEIALARMLEHLTDS
jgi:hypothetical protein